MRFLDAVDRFIADQKAHGRMRSEHSERAYRRCLELHGEDVGGRDPSKVGKRDVMRTLERWPHPNSRRQKHAILRSFYAWTVWEDIRTTNPAEQVRPARPVKAQSTRLTREEAVRMLAAADARRRDRWAVRLMLLGGLRNEEVRGLRGRHLVRDGWIWVDREIGKGSKERWIPVTAELEPVVAEIRAQVGPDDYVLPGQVRANPPHGDEMIERPRRRLSAKSLARIVERAATDAQIGVHVTPHTLRHTFGEHVARTAGLRVAQAALGHESVETTAGTYTSGAGLDELQVSFHGFGYGLPELSPHEQPQEAHDD